MADVFTWKLRCTALFLLLLFPTSCLQQRDVSLELDLTCLRNSTTSLSSAFTRNLNTVLRNFTTRASQGSRYASITSAGISDQDMVYAAFQCRGDLSAQRCGECVRNVTARLPQECPESVGARIRVDYCYLRYDNQSFFVLDTTFMIGFCDFDKTSDEATLGTIFDVYDNVTTEAPKHGGWASARAMGIYAAAQCMGYLNQSDCAACLSTRSYRDLLDFCDYSLGVRLFLSSCDVRYASYNFLEMPPSVLAPAPSVSDLVPSPAPRLNSSVPLGTPAQSPTGSKTSTRIIVVSVVASVTIAVGAICAILLWRYKARNTKGKSHEKEVDKSASWPPQLLQNKAQVFSLRELEEATDHFHPTNKLGEGGFGIVYKGTLKNGEQVAIKKLSVGREQGKKEFLNEVNLITSVQHKNLIRLLGCCVEDPERILVYEYLQNGSLDFFISARANWSTRYGIVVGMAKGLAYLHEESHTRIIHRDVKPSNILLDEQLNPVIADFGLAKLVKDKASHVSTGVVGTIGYMAPEYALHGALSEKVDVFSFGLVSLEVITGKENVHSKLLSWVWEKYQQGKLLDLVDDRLLNAYSPEQVIRVVHIALLCTQENPKQRPAMSMVNLWLSGASDILEIPIRPTFLDYIDSKATIGEQMTSASSISSESTHVVGGQVPWMSGGVQSFSKINPR